jgi:ADP-heptose:LPS heptosyltransferase
LNSVVVLMPELFGDVIMTTPLIRALDSIAPAAEIIVVGRGPGVRLLSHDDRVTQAIDLREASKEERRALFARRYDVLLSTKDHPSFTNLRLVRQFKVGYRIGFDHPGHEGFFHCLVARPEQMPVWEKAFGLVETLGSVPSVAPYLPDGPVTPAITEFVASELAGRSVLAVNISASKPEKRWPMARWSELLSEVTSPFVVLAAPEHATDKRELESGFSGAIPSPATENLFDVGEIVRHSSMLLTTDTAAVHVASCFDTPVLALYRNSRDLAKFPPLSERNHVLLALDDDLTSISVAEVREGLNVFNRDLKEVKPESKDG